MIVRRGEYLPDGYDIKRLIMPNAFHLLIFVMSTRYIYITNGRTQICPIRAVSVNSSHISAIYVSASIVIICKTVEGITRRFV